MNTKNLVAITLGSALAAAAISSAHATDNPFSSTQLKAGYQLAQADTKHADKKKDGKCGEGKCGADKKKDGKCGEGKCGTDKKK